MENSDFKQVNMPEHVCLRSNHNLFYIKMHWSYFKYNDLLHRSYVYKFPRKEHQVVYFSVTDEIAAPVILFWKNLEYVPLV